MFNKIVISMTIAGYPDDKWIFHIWRLFCHCSFFWSIKLCFVVVAFPGELYLYVCKSNCTLHQRNGYLHTSVRPISMLLRASYIGRVKRKSAFEHAKNVRIHIVLRIRKVSSGPLLSMDTFYGIHWFRLQRPWSDYAKDTFSHGAFSE